MWNRFKKWLREPGEPTGMEAATIEFHKRMKSKFKCRTCNLGREICRGIGGNDVRCFHPLGTFLVWGEIDVDI